MYECAELNTIRLDELTIDGAAQYQWISDSKVFVARRHVGGSSSEDAIKASCFDLDTSRESALANFNSASSDLLPTMVVRWQDDEKRIAAAYDLNPLSMAHDRNWIVWARGAEWICAAVGQECVMRTIRNVGSSALAHWIPGEIGWFEFAESTAVGGEVEFVVHRRLPDGRPQDDADCEHGPIVGTMVGALSNREILSARLKKREGRMHTETCIATLKAGSVRSDSFSTELGRHFVQIETCLSPGANLIAWLFYADNVAEPSLGMHWLFISDLRLARMEPIGTLGTGSPTEQHGKVSRLQWLPSGRHLSFLWRNRIHLVAVPTFD